MKLVKLLSIAILALLAPSIINAQCSIPNILLDIGKPSVSLVERFQQYEKDSLQFEKIDTCQLEFYIQYTYCLRRIDQPQKALALIDSIYQTFDIEAYVLVDTELLLEKALLLSYQTRDTLFENLLHKIKNRLTDNHFFEKEKNRDQVLDILSVSAGLYSEAEDYTFANGLLEKQLEFNVDDDPFVAFHNHFMIGLNNLNSNSYHNAYDALLKAAQYKNREGIDSSMIAEFSILMGTTLTQLDSAEVAEKYFTDALALDGDKVHIETYALIGLSKIYDNLGQYESLKMVAQKMEAITDVAFFPNYLKRDIYHYFTIVNLYDRDYQKFKANKIILEESIDTSNIHGKFLLSQLYLHDAVLKNFTPKEHNIFIKNRSLNFKKRNNDQIENLNSLKLKFESEKKEAENQLLKNEKELHTATIQNQQFSLFGSSFGILLLGLISFLLYKRSQERKENNNILTEKNKNIQLLHKDVSHRMKNNLSFISTLLQMQGRRLESGEAKQAIKEGETRVEAMSILHRKLHMQPEETSVLLGDYLEELCTNLKETYPYLGKQPIINHNVENIQMDGDTAVRVGLIVNELVTNSFKYAFVNQPNPTLDIQVKKNNDSLELIYQDNGMGLPETFNEKQTKSLGFKLIQTMTKQLEGTMQVENKDGAFFHFNFKDQKILN